MQIVGQDGILRAGWQPALVGLLNAIQAGCPPAAGFQPAPQVFVIPYSVLALKNRMGAIK
jgi:hypothetical protein